MRYREIKPTPSLRSFVECFWTLEGESSVDESPPERILPDGLLAASVIERRGLVSIDQLASHAGVSSRQLERRFLQEVRLGPKLLARIVRFQQVFRAVDQSNPAWAEVQSNAAIMTKRT